MGSFISESPLPAGQPRWRLNPRHLIQPAGWPGQPRWRLNPRHLIQPAGWPAGRLADVSLTLSDPKCYPPLLGTGLAGRPAPLASGFGGEVRGSAGAGSMMAAAATARTGTANGRGGGALLAAPSSTFGGNTLSDKKIKKK